MIWFCLVIPIVCLAIQYFYFYSHIHWAEYLAQLGIPLLVIIGCSLLFKSMGTWDTEYHGGYVVSGYHEEDWNEYIHQTCTTTDSKGNTTTYDCSYVQYHSEFWGIVDSNGSRRSVSKSHYNELVSRWANQKKTGHNRGYTNSGDIFGITFVGGDEKLEPVVTEKHYENRVQASKSVFNFPKVSATEIEDFGLFEYPKVSGIYTPSVLGFKNCRCFDILNARLGRQKQIRVWVLVYENQSLEAFEQQRNYWKGGNKNELILGIGIDSSKKVTWGNVITWCEQDEFNVGAKRAITDMMGSELNLCTLEKKVTPLIKDKWVRKEFADFSYLTIDIPMFAVIMSMVLTIAVSTTILIISVKNDKHCEH